ncbi:MAG: SDR family oxidoreductase [Haloarculaceae archaeon]
MSTPTAIVTGAATGLGEAIARDLGRANCLVVCAARDGETGESVAADIREAGGEAVAVRTDVRDEFDLERTCETAAREGQGGIDAVVPAAAVDHAGSSQVPLGGDSYAAFDDQFRTNARGVYATVRESIPHLVEEARVVVPVHGTDDPGAGGTYAVSRASTVALVRGFAKELPGPVGGLDPGHPVPAFERQADLDPAEAAASVRWALLDAPAEDIDGRVLREEAWRS